MLLQVYQALVGIYYLFQVDVLFNDMRERVFCIIVFVHLHNFFQLYLGLYHYGGEDTSRKVASIRYEVDFRVETVLQLF